MPCALLGENANDDACPRLVFDLAVNTINDSVTAGSPQLIAWEATFTNHIDLPGSGVSCYWSGRSDSGAAGRAEYGLNFVDINGVNTLQFYLVTVAANGTLIDAIEGSQNVDTDGLPITLLSTVEIELITKFGTSLDQPNQTSTVTVQF